MDVTGISDTVRYALVMVNGDTGYPEHAEMANATLEEVADAIIDKILCRWGPPEMLRSDLGKNIMSNLMNEINKSFGIVHIGTAGYELVIEAEGLLI